MSERQILNEIAEQVRLREAAEARADELQRERDEAREILDGSHARGYREGVQAEREQARREADQLRERCPVCTHEWRRHDPEDGKCDAGTDDLGECPCGRDIAFHRVRNAALSLAALAGVQAEEQTT